VSRTSRGMVLIVSRDVLGGSWGQAKGVQFTGKTEQGAVAACR
jgi:hypothetical protein